VEFQRELLARLPLADSVLSLLGYLWSPSFLDGLFDAHRGRCYEQDLTFPRLVELVRDALLVHRGSGRASFEAADARGELPVLAGSVYQKLARLPVAVSQALPRETACRLPELLPRAGAGDDAHDPPPPASLRDLEVVALDGKVLKHVHRRLKPLRPLRPAAGPAAGRAGAGGAGDAFGAGAGDGRVRGRRAQRLPAGARRGRAGPGDGGRGA
jgi:hypothetical protein